MWKRIDETVVGAAKMQLSARRLLHVDGPYGLGVKSLPGPSKQVEGAAEEGVAMFADRPIPLAMIEAGFCLPVRDVAAFEKTGLPFDLGVVARAAVACARQEDELLLDGSKALGLEGLLSTKGAQSAELQAWDEPGAAADDLIAAVTKLDEAGFHGPYAVALAPDRYNLLFRRYPQGNMTEMQHVKELLSAGIIKAPAIASGGVLLQSGRPFASIALGQDLTAGFVGPAGADYEFTVAETVALRLLQPAAVCVLK